LINAEGNCVLDEGEGLEVSKLEVSKWKFTWKFPEVYVEVSPPTFALLEGYWKVT
jgi:hypothetical protein